MARGLRRLEVGGTASLLRRFAQSLQLLCDVHDIDGPSSGISFNWRGRLKPQGGKLLSYLMQTIGKGKVR